MSSTRSMIYSNSGSPAMRIRDPRTKAGWFNSDQREKFKIWHLLTVIEMTLDDASEDLGRYVIMGMRLEPDNPDVLERN